MSDFGREVEDDDGDPVRGYRTPSAEPWVDDEFPPSAYLADPEFGHRFDDGDDEADERDLSSRNSGLGDRHLAGAPTAGDWADGDAADEQRRIADLRLRLDPASAGDRGDLSERADGNIGFARATTFDGGAENLAGSIDRTPRGGEAVQIGRILERATAPVVVDIDRGRSVVEILVCAPMGITVLKDGTVSVTFHVPPELADQAFSIHPYMKAPVKLRLYEVR